MVNRSGEVDGPQDSTPWPEVFSELVLQEFPELGVGTSASLPFHSTFAGAVGTAKDNELPRCLSGEIDELTLRKAESLRNTACPTAQG